VSDGCEMGVDGCEMGVDGCCEVFGKLCFENYRKIDLKMNEASKSLALPAVDVWYYVCSSDKKFFSNSKS